MIRKINDQIIEVGVRAPSKPYFDNFIPLPRGTSYNSYIIKGSEKIAIIDTVEPEYADEFLCNVQECMREMGIEKIDYIISNHSEQDHSGCIPLVRERFPGSKVIVNERSKELLSELIHLKDEDMIIIKENEEISLGDKTLRFILTPWVHWPETMCTYLKEDKILFTCDFFGSHFSSDELYVKDAESVVHEAKRYYAELMMAFRVIIKVNMKKLEKIEIETIAPAHGPVYDNPKIIIDAYNQWISDDCKKEVVILYVTMHESTHIMAEYLKSKFEGKVEVKLMDLMKCDLGEMAIELVEAETILFGSPAYISGPHPVAANAAYSINVLKPKAKYIGFFGSYGWANKLEEYFIRMTDNIHAERLPSIIVKGKPREEDFRKMDEVVEKIINTM
ncbi:FprA family A-type flavoprotein [Candidatus Woesearchaeota archaeon]|nr:FprA family A-type flavoprotein [Candidatus Woesearchaeota archaeon]